ncbi:MAG: GIY-YIG nuclease family protein, partial [Fusobacteriaceae bacterium]
MKSGIYLIVNNNNGRVYVGQSKNVKTRIAVHKRELKKNTHPNSYMRNDYNKYLGKNFKFEILEKCSIEKLDIKEKNWISLLGSVERDKGYNRESGGTTGKVYDDERIASIKGKGNPMYGKNHSSEAKDNIRNANRGNNNKLSLEAVKEVKIKLAEGYNQSQLAEEYQVTISTINKIFVFKNWSWVLSKLNPKLKEIKECKELFRNDKKLKVKRDKENLENEYAEKKIKYENIKKSYSEGIPKDTILKMFNISKTTYVRIISEIYNQDKKDKIMQVIDLKEKGMMNKDIAQKLKIHRTTVTEYIKKYNSMLIP